MNDTSISSAAQKTTIEYVVAGAALLLLTLGATVLYSWHHLTDFLYSSAIVTMPYSSAIGFALSSIALLALLNAQVRLLRVSATLALIISSLIFLEGVSGLDVGLHYQLMNTVKELPKTPAFMSPSTAACFTLTSLSFLLISLNFSLASNRLIIPVVFLNLIVITISVIALLGHGIGILPAFVWLGIKMAPHTALGLIVLSMAIIFYTNHHATEAFNRLNFFSRMIIGFGFMATLVVAIGSIAFMQLSTVSTIAHEIYNNPLQTNNAVTHIRIELGDLNRSLKNIAIKPEVSDYQRIPEMFEATDHTIKNNVAEMRTNDAAFDADLDKFLKGYTDWKNYSLESYEFLKRKAYESYALRTLYDGQEQVTELEIILSNIDGRAQERITELNNAIGRTERDAKKLVAFIVLCFLVVGLVVAILITKSLNSQLRRIRSSMLDIAHEKLEGTIPFLDHTQEIGDMARTLAIFAENIEARRQLESRLRQVVETMPNGIVMVNQAGTIEIVNAQAEKIFGYDRSELLGKSVEQLIPKNAAKDHPHNREQFFANPSPRVMGAGRELFGLRRDGTEFPLEIGLAPIETKEGLKVLASIVDITERRNAELALNESRERLELTTRVNQIGVWEYDLDTGELYWNDTMFDIYARSKEYFTSEMSAWTQCVHPDDLEKTQNLFQHAIESSTPYTAKFRIIQPNGSVKHLLGKAKVERKSNGQLRVLGTNMDITREELALAKLHNLEVLRSAIVEFSEDAIISTTPQGIITSWNSGAHNMFNYAAEEVIGKSIVNLLFTEKYAADEEMLLAQVRSGSVVKHFETVCRCQGGKLITVSNTLSPIKDATGNIIGISAIKRDITESLEAARTLNERQRELEKSNNELARSNKELETFAYVASHDLKSPLRGVAQLSAWVEEDIEAGEYSSVSGHTNMMRNRIQRMEKLLDDLLVFYRAGKAEGELVTVNVGEMSKELFDIQNTKQGLRLELGTSLPTFATLSVPLEQVIRNFFSNAIKHHDRAEGLIKLDCNDLDKNFYEFSVCDDGPGIPEKYHERIFGMFQTLKPRDELEGSGMGLALIRKIVENYGGRVSIHSEGRGCCFYFTWPKHIHGDEES